MGASRIRGVLGTLVLSAPAAFAADPQVAPKPVDPVSAGSLLNLMLSLLLVIAAIFAAAWLLRRITAFQSPAGSALRLLGGLTVGQRERVVLVQVGETQLLLGVAPGEVRTLHVLEHPVEVGAGESEVSFAERLSRSLGRGEAK